MTDFNSHAHVERDHAAVGKWITAEISTHTLTWSVTVIPHTKSPKQSISTHTLTWSVTPFWF